MGLFGGGNQEAEETPESPAESPDEESGPPACARCAGTGLEPGMPAYEGTVCAQCGGSPYGAPPGEGDSGEAPESPEEPEEPEPEETLENLTEPQQ